MEAMELAATTLAYKSHKVRQHFLDLSALLNNENHDEESHNAELPASAAAAAADSLERFTLWAGNLGAMHAPSSRLSLDFRLLDAEDIRRQISRQLDEIIEAIEDCMFSGMILRRTPFMAPFACPSL